MVSDPAPPPPPRCQGECWRGRATPPHLKRGLHLTGGRAETRGCLVPRPLREGPPRVHRLGCSAGPHRHGGHEAEFLGSRSPLLDCREGQQKVADVFLAREQEFEHLAAHILQFDRYLSLLAENCLHAPRLAAAVREFEVGPLVLPGTRSQNVGVEAGMERLHANQGKVRPGWVGKRG